MTNASTHLFWVLSRGAGTTALILASASVGFGLAIGGKLIKGGGPDRRAYHEVLSLAVMVAIAVHGLALIGDSFLRPSFLDVTVPFVFSYKTLSTSIGIVAGWGMIILGLSYYVRDRIGNERWKFIHRFTLLAWLGGLVHGHAPQPRERGDERRNRDRGRRPRRPARRRDASTPGLRGTAADGLRRAPPSLRPPAAVKGGPERGARRGLRPLPARRLV
jgi:sulfoxide reductase heme-binding subunit YedZ